MYIPYQFTTVPAMMNHIYLVTFVYFSSCDNEVSPLMLVVGSVAFRHINSIQAPSLIGRNEIFRDMCYCT